MFNQYKPSYSFSAYANRPLAGQLAKIVQENPGCTLIIEGELRTFYSKRTKFYQTTILITKIIN
ncbi:MAG: DUF3217 domain-containing protein [Mycoplasmoidaceae bacterium]|nr:DUF3217 domain-containing protein [Mycoplasmoidaceae bacterium]